MKGLLEWVRERRGCLGSRDRMWTIVRYKRSLSLSLCWLLVSFASMWACTNSSSSLSSLKMIAVILEGRSDLPCTAPVTSPQARSWSDPGTREAEPVTFKLPQLRVFATQLKASQGHSVDSSSWHSLPEALPTQSFLLWDILWKMLHINMLFVNYTLFVTRLSYGLFFFPCKIHSSTHMSPKLPGFSRQTAQVEKPAPSFVR